MRLLLLLSGLSAKTLKSVEGSALTANSIESGSAVLLFYDGTDCALIVTVIGPARRGETTLEHVMTLRDADTEYQPDPLHHTHNNKRLGRGISFHRDGLHDRGFAGHYSAARRRT